MVSLRAKRGNLSLNGVIASEARQSQPFINKINTMQKVLEKES